MATTAIFHAPTRVIRRVTTADIAEVGVAEDEDYLVLPPESEKPDLSLRLKVDALGQLSLATPQEIDDAGIDPDIERTKADLRRQRQREARQAVLALDPVNDNVRTMIATIIAYVRFLD